MVIVECPWCDAAVALNESDAELVCEGCSISVEIGMDAVIDVPRAA